MNRSSKVERYYIDSELSSKGVTLYTVNRQVGRQKKRLLYFIDKKMASDYVSKCQRMMHARHSRRQHQK